MAYLLQHLISNSAQSFGNNIALKYKETSVSYLELQTQVENISSALLEIGLSKNDRVAIYAEKRIETIVGMFATSAAGGVFVPINPLLKAEQVGYILKDCDVRILITTTERLNTLVETIAECPQLECVIVVGKLSELSIPNITFKNWDALLVQQQNIKLSHRIIDGDMAAILYTSGSTGKPKGVVLSHRNIIAGAMSVAEYLELTQEDRLLSVLPLSFDYGLNQITTSFLVGGCAVLMNYLFPRDIINIIEKEKVTGLAAVPPLWIQLAKLDWPASIQGHLRYFTNSGGAMPTATLAQLRSSLPKTKPYLMYGLTEAFRSTYLPPEEIDKRPDSMGKAIPNAEIMIVKEDGTPCRPNETGELVHRGVLVSLGYWNDSEKTAERFKPAPNQISGLPITELAVWSGDTVRIDEEGFLYFVGRRDEMIKTSGYRVSPAEIEEILYSTKLVGEVAALGISHPTLGQAIAVIATPAPGIVLDANILKTACQKHLPAYMVPLHIEITTESLPRNPNGKIDRKALSLERQELFSNLS